MLNAILGKNLSCAIFRSIENGSLDYSFADSQYEHLSYIVDKSRSLIQDSQVLANMDICGGFQMIADQIPNGKSSCICKDNSVQCTLPGQCSSDGSVCTDTLALSFGFLVENSKVSNMLLSACFSYTKGFQPTCIQTTLGYDQAIKTCNKATYGGEACICQVCNDEKSLSLDCSMHDPKASSNGCYLLSDAIPALKKFDQPPGSNARFRRTTISTKSQLLKSEELVEDTSGAVDNNLHLMFSLLAFMVGALLI